jgi:hypothetical protein
MRSLQHGLGKRSPLFFDFNAGVSFNPSAYTALDFNKTPVTAPITLTSSAAAPVDTPAAYFTSSVNNPTASPFDNSVSFQPWTADSANSANLAWGTFGADGNFDFSGKTNPYWEANKQSEKAEEDLRRIQGEEAKAEAQKWAGLFEFLNKIFSTMAGVMGTPSIGGTATTAPAPAPAAA